MRRGTTQRVQRLVQVFPFLFGGTFIEAGCSVKIGDFRGFPFLFGGTFIEAPATLQSER